MCRRFRQLQARLVLEKQDQLREIEEEIRDLDRSDFLEVDSDEDEEAGRLSENGENVEILWTPYRLTTRRRRNEKEQQQRDSLMARAEEKFKEYAELLSAAQRLACFEKPRKGEYKSLYDFIFGTAPVRPSEFEWIGEDYKRDLVSLRGARMYARVGALVETIINRLRASELFKVWRPTMSQWLAENKVSERAGEYVVNVILVLLVPVMFVIPIYALSKIGNSIGKSIGVLLSFALIFTFFLAMGTPAKSHEILSVSAA